MSAEKRARELDGGEYERALADSLRQLADAEWTLSGEPMPQDVRQVLNSAAAMLVMNRSIMDTRLTTIRLQSQFIEAIGNEVRAAGCEFNPVTGAVVNHAALTPQWQDISTAPRDGTWIILGLSENWKLGVEGRSCPGYWLEGWDHGADYEGRESGWVDAYHNDVEPRCWLPLPAPQDGEQSILQSAVK